MTSRNKLTTYRGKRHFGRTREPQGGHASAGDTLCFVVQIHDASTLHVDFRLDVKEGDERAGRRGAPDARRARSVRSGRTLKRVAQEEGGERGSA